MLKKLKIIFYIAIYIPAVFAILCLFYGSIPYTNNLIGFCTIKLNTSISIILSALALDLLVRNKTIYTFKEVRSKILKFFNREKNIKIFYFAICIFALFQILQAFIFDIPDATYQNLLEYAPLPAICLLFLSLSVINLLRDNSNFTSIFFNTFCASVIVFLSTLSLVNDFLIEGQTTFWMANQTSFSFLSFGVAISLLLYLKEPPHNLQKSNSINILIFSVCISFLIWSILTTHASKQLKTLSNEYLLNVKKELEHTLEDNILFAEGIAKRWSANKKFNKESLYIDIKILLENISFIESIVWFHPKKGSQYYINKNKTLRSLPSYLEKQMIKDLKNRKKIKLNNVWISKCFENSSAIEVNKRKFFATYIPLYQKKVFYGYLAVIFEINKLYKLKEISALQFFDLRITEDGKTIYYFGQKNTEYADLYNQVKKLSVFNLKWELHQQISNAWIDVHSSHVPEIIAIFFMLIGILLAFTLYSFTRSKIQVNERDHWFYAFQYSGVAMAMYNKDTVLSQANLAWFTLFKHNKNALNKVKISDIYAFDFNHLDHELKKNIDQMRYVEYTVELKKSTGENFTAFLNMSLIKDKNNDTTNYFITIRNLSGLRKNLHAYEKSLIDTIDELNYSNKNLDAFAYSASHDLKEPIRSIESYANFLIEDCFHQLDENGKNYLKKIKETTQRSQDLLESLLHYSRLGRKKNVLIKINTYKLVENTLKDFEYLIVKENVEITIDQNLPEIVADEAKMKEVFMNLIQNGIKYNNSELKKIKIGFKEKEKTFFVSDNGIGILKKNTEKIFQIFKRMHSQKEFGGGSGVGLALVKDIIELHKGNIWIESTINEGTTFYFNLES